MRTLGRICGCLLIAAAGLAVPLQGVALAQTGKLVVIVMENETYASIVGNPQAPYLNQLIAQGKLFTNYAAVASGSNPNYLAMTSGLTSAQSPPAPNIFQAIDGSGGALTWKQFMESMPGNCAQGTRVDVPGTSVPLYTSDHDPDYQYRSSTSCAANDIPLTASTFNPASLPDLSYVVPNECDDMHTLPGSGQACPAYFGSNPGTSLVNMGDNWLATVVPSLLAQPKVTVLITWDEGTLSSTPSEHVVAVEAGAGVTPGSTDGTAYTHYGLEAGLYRYFGLGTAPGDGATATPLPISSPAGAPPTLSSFTPAAGPAGATVTINGGAFTGATAVKFNGVAASFTVNSDSELTAAVPAGATSGSIAVTTPAGTGTSQDSFTVTSGGPSPPAAPTGLTAVPSGSAVSLSWSDSDTSVSYQLEWSNDPGFGTYTSVSLPAGTTSYKDTGLGSAVYYYRLSALNSGSQSPYATASAATISYAALVAGRPGLQDQWRLGEASGTTANDSAGSYNGTYVNGPGLGSPGAIANDPNTSVTLNGTSQRVTLPSLPPAGDFSIEGWTYLTNGSVTNNTLYGSGTVRLLARPGTGPTAAYAGVTLNGTEYVLQPLNPVSNLNTWVYWVLTRQGSTLTLYRDGVQIAQRTDLPATATANISGYIGSQANGLYYLNGRVQDVAMYNRALSGAEVSNGYVAAVNGVPPSSSSGSTSYYSLVTADPTLLAYWRLGEASGTTANDSAGSYNGTYVNGPGLGSPGAIANDPNTSVTLNGTSQRVTLPSLPPAGDFSIEGWTYLTNGSVTNNTLYGSGTVRLLARPGTGPTAAYAGVTLNGTEYVLQPLNPVSNLNTWVYWVLTRQGSTLTLYRDGVQIAQRTDLPATATANISGYIGSQANGLYYLNGRADDVAIYSSALSPSTITSHYQAALSGPAPS